MSIVKNVHTWKKTRLPALTALMAFSWVLIKCHATVRFMIYTEVDLYNLEICSLYQLKSWFSLAGYLNCDTNILVYTHETLFNMCDRTKQITNWKCKHDYEYYPDSQPDFTIIFINLNFNLVTGESFKKGCMILCQQFQIVLVWLIVKSAMH